MYTIKITTSTNQDIRQIAQYIASLVEKATGEQCRVSILDNKANNEQMAGVKNEIVSKLQDKK